MEKLMCGNCGNKTFTISADAGFLAHKVEATCTKCESSTILTVTTPKISFEWGKGAEGILCPSGD